MFDNTISISWITGLDQYLCSETDILEFVYVMKPISNVASSS